MKKNKKSNIEYFLDEAKEQRLQLLKKTCEHMLRKNIKITPTTVADHMLNLATKNEQKYILKKDALRLKHLKWRSIIDEYEKMRLSNPINMQNKKIDVKFADQRLSQQNLLLREKVVELSEEVTILKAALRRRDVAQKKPISQNISNEIDMVPVDDETDYKNILSGVILQLIRSTHLTELDKQGNLKVFGKDGKVMLLTSKIMKKLNIYG